MSPTCYALPDRVELNAISGNSVAIAQLTHYPEGQASVTQDAASRKEWYGTGVYSSKMGLYTGGFEQAVIAQELDRIGTNVSVLDVGGGDGRNAVFAKEVGHDPVLLEYEPLPLQLFLERGVTLPAVQASGMELPVADGSFQAVMTIGVSACFTGQDDINVRFFAEVHRVLKPGGLFLLTAHNKGSYIGRIRQTHGEGPGWAGYYTDDCDDYSRKLNAAGFDITACHGYRWLPFPHNSNNPLIPALALVEKVLPLRRSTRFSPWLFFVARKR